MYAFSVACDESCDVKDEAQFPLEARQLCETSLREELLPQLAFQ